jgi:hypothetical protein
VYKRGGAPLEVALKKNIIHLHYDMLITPEQIAPLIVSPRCEGGVHVETVKKVIEHFEIFLTVNNSLPGSRAAARCLPRTSSS